MDLETCGLSGSFVFLSFSLSSFSASVSFSFRNVAERRLESKLIPKWRSTGEIQLFAELHVDQQRRENLGVIRIYIVGYGVTALTRERKTQLRIAA